MVVKGATTLPIQVSSELGRLRRVLIHSPDGGIGKIIPAKAQEWLYEDIVQMQKMQEEYDVFKKVLLAFLDPQSLLAWESLSKKSTTTKRPKHLIPGSEGFIDSNYVIEAQHILGKILYNETVRLRLVASICAIENCSFAWMEYLSDSSKLSPEDLAKTLITGVVKGPTGDKTYIFPPIPNFVFTRDLGTVIGQQVLISKTSSSIRRRESILSQYLVRYSLLSENKERILEISDDSEVFLAETSESQKHIVTVEGGDVMMVHPQHLLIGCSERTSPNAIRKIIQILFSNPESTVHKISVIWIPHQRSMMHIDTVFTQVTRGTWVIYGPISKASKKNTRLDDFAGNTQEDVCILQYIRRSDNSGDFQVNDQIKSLEDLLKHISTDDFSVSAGEVNFIYSGDGQFPYADREQWTDSCNVVALSEGLVIGYDRNEMTARAFERLGFNICRAEELISSLLKENSSLSQVLAKTEQFITKKSLILLPSSELSRARGGAHCMTMPLLRDHL